jgi:oxaloacetate decarboxylase alpha subunit
MRKFRVRVDGREYLVEVTEEGEVKGVSHEFREEVVQKREEKTEPEPKSDKKTSTGSVVAPIAGKILKVLKKEGDDVEEGEVLFILEAMKMENEIYAPKTGGLKKIYIKEGDSVEESQRLCDIA